MIKILLIPPLLIDKKSLNEIKIKAKYLSKFKNIYQSCCYLLLAKYLKQNIFTRIYNIHLNERLLTPSGQQKCLQMAIIDYVKNRNHK